MIWVVLIALAEGAVTVWLASEREEIQRKLADRQYDLRQQMDYLLRSITTDVDREVARYHGKRFTPPNETWGQKPKPKPKPKAGSG